MKRSSAHQIFHPGRRVGVIGGGQLARMLAIEGFKMGLEMHALSSSADDPAAQVTRFWHMGDVDNNEHVTQFLKSVDIATVESEFLNCKILESAAAASGVNILPSPNLLGRLSDRKTQKDWLVRNKIPTAPFVAFKTIDDVYAFFKDQKQIVIKKRRFGYDGYGTFIIRKSAELEAWLKRFGGTIEDFIGETFVPFRRELALQIARNQNGEILCYPLVEWKAQASRCLWVNGPVTSPRVPALIHQATRAIESSDYAGLLTFELFETSGRGRSFGNLIVNEIAPRVHNSGHYTLEAMALNQFQAHLRAILNMPLPKKPDLWAGGFAMWNLLGTTEQPASSCAWRPPGQNSSDTQVHWYGKKEIRPGRKVGHLTTLAPTRLAALKKLQKAIKGFRL